MRGSLLSTIIKLLSVWAVVLSSTASAQLAPTRRYLEPGHDGSALRLPPSLVVVTESIAVTEGDLAFGAPFLKMSVRHEHSGRLSEDLIATSMFYGRTRKVLAPAGSYVFQWRFVQRDTTQIGEGVFADGRTINLHQRSDAFLMCGVAGQTDLALWRGDGFCVTAMVPKNTLTQTTRVLESVGGDEMHGLGIPSPHFPMHPSAGAKQQSAFVWRETGEDPPQPLTVQASVTRWYDRPQVEVIGSDGVRRTLLTRHDLDARAGEAVTIAVVGRQIELTSASSGRYRVQAASR
jgi:hypothetical protein